MTLEEQIRALVREELRAHGIAPAAYDSTNLPPGITSREHFAAECRRLRVGRKDGRVWTVDAETWRNARASARRRSHLRVVNQSDVARADAYLSDAGVRPTRPRT